MQREGFVLIACWSPKGGSGTTVVSAILALVLGRSSPQGALLADFCGDLPAALGVGDVSGPGLADWLSASPDVGPEALARLEVAVAPLVKLLPKGSRFPPGSGGRAELLASAFNSDSRPIVADCGPAERPPALEVAAGASLSLVVVRPCYLALRRVLSAPVRASGVVLVDEPERALRRRDVEDVLGLPVWAELPRSAALARAVDAGLLATRVPRTVERALQRATVAVAR